MPSRRRSTRRGKAARYVWEQANENEVTIAANGTSVTKLLPTDEGVLLEARGGLTVVRLLGNVAYFVTAPNIAGTIRVAGGALVTNDSQFDAGASALPRPDLAGGPFMWQSTEGFRNEPASGGGAGRNMDVNSRTGRKILGARGVLLFMLRNISSVNLTVTINLRVLYRLP